MTRPPDPDLLIRAYLDEGVTELADRVYEVVRSETDRTRQRVVIGPRRISDMNSFARVAIAIAAVVVIAIIGYNLLPSEGGVGGPSASPSESPSTSASASASPSASTQAFTSPFYGYTVTVPSGWTAEAATVKWDGKGAPGSTAPPVDQFSSTGQASVFAFAAPISLDLAGYAADVIARNEEFHGDTCKTKPEATEATTIGSEPAAFIAWDCGILINIALATHQGTGYEFVFRDPDVHHATDDADRAIFDSMLSSVSFGS